ncbi:MAG: hypothetical protein WA634_17260, partial [Silvibacterium sp.]
HFVKKVLPNRVIRGVETLAMAWLTLIVGGAILLIGLFGQVFGVKHHHPAHPDDKRVGKIVVSIGSAVVGLWLVAFSAAQLLHLHTVGHW